MQQYRHDIMAQDIKLAFASLQNKTEPPNNHVNLECGKTNSGFHNEKGRACIATPDSQCTLTLYLVASQRPATWSSSILYLPSLNWKVNVAI
jgi:hypothetical protein